MTKQIHNEKQGSAEWLSLRMTKRPASLISAVMGLSPYTSRAEVLKTYATGIPAEINSFVEKFIFAEGHRVEPIAREMIENIIGEDLSPMIYSKGLLSASTDGINFSETIGFECKQWNGKLAELVRDGVVPDSHMPQVQQCLLVTDAEEWYFTVSDGTEENTVYTIVKPDASWFKRIIDAWDQFDIDLANYNPVIHNEKPEADAIKELPALFVHAYGEITTNNMEDYGIALTQRLAEVRSIVLVEDIDFSNAKKAAKDFRSQIEKLELVKTGMLEQTTTIGEAARMISDWQEDLRITALQLEKDVKREDLAKKEGIISGAKTAFDYHLTELGNTILPIRLNITKPNFAEAIAKKRDYNSMQNAVDTMLANEKIKANNIAKDVQGKLAYFNEVAFDYKFLFNDLQQIIGFEKDHFEMAVTTRIENHKRVESEKLELQRKRIEEDARRKAEAEQAKKLEAERAAIREEERKKVALAMHEERLAEKERQKIETPETLRASADRIEQSAQYADRNEDRKREIAIANDLRKQANELEQVSFKDKLEVFPTVIEEAEPTVTITVSEHQRLLDRIYWLECLEAAGVDNWSGYDYAREIYQRSDIDQAA